MALTSIFSAPEAIGSQTEDYGFDVLCLPDLDVTLTPRNDRTVLADQLARRFLTAKGKLPFYPNYGMDLRDYLNDEITGDMLAALRSEIEGQAEQDERVEAAQTSVTYNSRLQLLRVRIALQTAAGPFSLVFSVTELTAEVLVEEA